MHSYACLKVNDNHAKQQKLQDLLDIAQEEQMNDSRGTEVDDEHKKAMEQDTTRVSPRSASDPLC